MLRQLLPVHKDLMKNYKKSIDVTALPGHVAIIMDGNGRWAQKYSVPRIEGHRKGADVIEPVVDAALELGIGVLTLYAFSTENWIRPADEIQGLWKILDYYFKMKLETIIRKGIRIRHSGRLEQLPEKTVNTITNAIHKTAHNDKLVLNFCLNYGGQQEILDAVNAWVTCRKGNESMTADSMRDNLYTAGLPDVDLMIRTSGEYRISNFLLWQLAYSELVFLDVLWPDFTQNDFYKAVYLYQHRERRYGGI